VFVRIILVRVFWNASLSTFLDIMQQLSTPITLKMNEPLSRKPKILYKINRNNISFLPLISVFQVIIARFWERNWRFECLMTVRRNYGQEKLRNAKISFNWITNNTRIWRLDNLAIPLFIWFLSILLKVRILAVPSWSNLSNVIILQTNIGSKFKFSSF